MASKHVPRFIQGSSGKGIVIFINGFMGSPNQFDYLMEAFNQNGYSMK